MPIGSRIGQYEVIRLLGQGGMGEVYLARDLRLGRLVAVKLLTQQTPNLDERLLAEARLTARCRHDNIVVIYEVGAQAGRPYMVLEYLEGQSLRQWMNDQAASSGPPAGVPPTRAVDLMLPVVRALAYAHDQGIIHRDLKPENVMLTRAGVIKVLDFGVAKHVESAAGGPDSEADVPAAGASAPVGTRAYMAPEQGGPGAVDHRADVWAVGIMLFELVAGAHPVLDPPTAQAAQAAADEHPAMPSAGERVPGLGPLAGVIDRCLIMDPEHRTPSARTLLAELEALAKSRGSLPLGHDGSPFAGLAAFQEADADRFFGRDRDIDQVVAELRSRPLVAVVGPSGAGKSSLVRAGILPALKRSGEIWDAHIVRPGREPLGGLAGVLAQRDRTTEADAPGAAPVEDAVRTIVEQLRAEPGMLGARLRALAASRRCRIAVFVDQLEELYTLGAPPAERAAFLACLAAVADDAASPLRVLVSMRSDFIDRLAEDRRFGAEIARGLLLLSPMDREGMREALVRPVEASEHRFEPPALVDRMIDALAATPGALPLLQFTAARLWERRDRDRRLLTEASYDQLGGVAGALATHADAVLAGMSAAQQALARTIVERLVTPERTRAPVSMSELRALRPDAAVDDLVQHLAAMRLVVTERGTEDGDATVELVHESLIVRWPTLARWLDENQDDAVMLARLRVAARDWERGGQAAGLLWTGEIAREARAWQTRYRGELAPIEQRYLAAVLAAADRARRTRRRRFGGILVATALVAIAMAWLAWKQSEARRRAAEEATRARDATRMAALRTVPHDPTTQLALLREIEDVHASPPEAAQEAKRLLHAPLASVVLTTTEGIRAVSFSPDGRRIVFALSDYSVEVWDTEGRDVPVVLRGHDSDTQSVAFSPDGQHIVSASDDKTVRVWRADGTGEALVLRGHTAGARSAAFSPDGQRIVSASDDKTVRIWNADGSGQPWILHGHDDWVVSAQFSPDGRRIVSASYDKTLRVWNADGSGQPLVLCCHDHWIDAVAFSPDGRRIVSTSHDKTLRVWSADGGGEPLVLRGHGAGVTSAAFSPDGQRIVSASADRTLRIWNADGSGEPQILRGHDDIVEATAFSPDGRRIVSASDDRTLRVWNVDGARDPLVLHGHELTVNAAAFSPDGRSIVSASPDKTLRVWRSDGLGAPLVLRGHDGLLNAAAFSPDGRRIVSASHDETVRVWNADGRGEPLVLRGHAGMALGASFSPDGRRIVAAFADKTLRIWNADGSGAPLVLHGHDDLVLTAMFSPDGQHIVSASADKTLRIWSADGTGAPLVLRGHDRSVNSATWSPDGRRIVSASDDKTVRIWNADGTGDPLVLRGQDDKVYWAEFSPDGRTIVSASNDQTIRIWQADGSGGPVVLLGHESGVQQARFSPDGRSVVSASTDHTVRVWHDLAPATLDDPRLWTATSYCIPVERRIKLLGVSADQAQRDRKRCLARVERSHAP